MPAERRAIERFVALEGGVDHDGYLAACEAACLAGADAFNTLCDVALRRAPLRTPRGAELLQAASDRLVRHFEEIGE